MGDNADTGTPEWITEWQRTDLQRFLQAYASSYQEFKKHLILYAKEIRTLEDESRRVKIADVARGTIRLTAPVRELQNVARAWNEGASSYGDDVDRKMAKIDPAFLHTNCKAEDAEYKTILMKMQNLDERYHVEVKYQNEIMERMSMAIIRARLEHYSFALEEFSKAIRRHQEAIRDYNLTVAWNSSQRRELDSHEEEYTKSCRREFYDSKFAVKKVLRRVDKTERSFYQGKKSEGINIEGLDDREESKRFDELLRTKESELIVRCSSLPPAKELGKQNAREGRTEVWASGFDRCVRDEEERGNGKREPGACLLM